MLLVLYLKTYDQSQSYLDYIICFLLEDLVLDFTFRSTMQFELTFVKVKSVSRLWLLFCMWVFVSVVC